MASTQVIGEDAVKRVIRDMRSGMNDCDRVEKYNLSSDQKHVLSAVRRMLTGVIVSDIRSGMSAPDLSQKYGISCRTLRKITMKLVDAGAFSQDEIDGRCTAFWGKPDGGKTPRLPRSYLPYPVSVRVADESEADGLLLDISETGLSVSGIKPQVGGIKRFCVLANHNSRIPSFVFEAKCRWGSMEDDAEHIAGYSIENISDHDSRLLRNFIQALGRIWREPTQSE